MSPDAAAALLPFAGLAVDVVVQVLVLRAGARFGRSLAAGFAAGAAAMAALLCLPAFAGCGGDSGREGISLLVYGAYVGFGFGYFSFLNLNQASLRVRIMKELLAEGGSMAMDELLQRYNADHILDARLARLLEGRKIHQQRGVYLGGPRSEFLRLARLLDVLKLVTTGRKTCG